MNPIQHFLQQQGFVVLDGALATELERHGADLDDPLWSARCLIETPELIYRVHMDYLNAGADVLTTATYQASLPGFVNRGFSGHDLLAFETIPSLLEGELLLRLLKEFPDQYAWLSFSCSDAAHVSHGEAFQRCVQLAAGQAQLAAIGINCTAPRHIQSLLGAAQGLACPLLVYPNSGETWVAGGNRWAGQGGEDFDPNAWFQSGTRLIGGCCRTGPADIAAIRSVLSAFSVQGDTSQTI